MWDVPHLCDGITDAVNEMTRPTVRSAYDEWAATYDSDRNETRDLDAVVTRAMLGDRRYRRALEVGCGTGKNTAWLAGAADRVLAMDFSQAMLARARASTRASGVTFAQADVTRPWPVVTGCADLVTCSLVLEHVEHLDFVFTEAARALAPGGRMLVCELHPFRQYLGKRANFERGGVRVEPPAFTHHVCDFVAAAARAGLTLLRLDEWWDGDDRRAPPRLVSFVIEK